MIGKSNSGMYYMKPVISLPDKLPKSKVMYEMKNIHDHFGIASKIEQQAPLPEIVALETRQEKILGQLAELKKIIANLCVMVKDTNQTETTTVVKKEEIVKDPITVDLVIQVDRSLIPYSLLALMKTWQDTYFNISCHSHSDNDTLEFANEITSFEKIIQTYKQTQQNRSGLNVVNLTLIWRKTDVLKVNTGISRDYLFGETALLRLLSRLIESHNYESKLSLDELTSMDTILDFCYETNLSKDNKSLNDVIKKFDNALKNGNTWLASKSEATIADIAAWSVIRNRSIQKLPNNLAKWFDKCQKQFCC